MDIFAPISLILIPLIATPEMTVSPFQVIQEIWGGELPVFDGMDDLNALIGALVDGHGLAVEGKLTIGTKRGAEAYALMNDGALGLSVGFRVQPDGARYQGSTRILKGVDLLEISTVAMPANSFARVTGVKSALSKPVNIREFEAALRDACGLSVREAKRVASAGWPALQHRDDASDELKNIAALFSLAATEIQLSQ